MQATTTAFELPTSEPEPQLDPAEVRPSLVEILNYLADEEQSYENHIEHGGAPADHVWFHRERVRKAFNL